MNGTKPVNSPAQSPLPLSDAEGPAVGPGLGTLLQGQKNAPSPASATPEAAPPPSLKWALLAADALLVLLAAWLVFGRAQRLGVWEILLCVLALGIAAWLGCWAFLLSGKR